MLNLNIKLQITELWFIKPVYILKGSSIKLSLCHISRCLTLSPNRILFSDILFTSSCYGTLFQSLMLAPYCVGVKRQGVVPRGTRFWSQLLISLGWKIQVHSKCALRSAWLPSPTLHRGGVGLCPFPLRERTELSTNRDFPLLAKKTAQKDLWLRE